MDIIDMHNKDMRLISYENITEEVLNKTATVENLNSILKKLCCSEYINRRNIKEKVNLSYFYEISNKILGIHKQVEPRNKQELTVRELYDLFLEMLNEKTASGRFCVEELIMKGAFSDYNLEKAVPEIMVLGGKTQPIFDYSKCIFEKVFVETPVDTDGDGKLDLVAVYIRRPEETLRGMKVPAIYVANPYMLKCNEDWYNVHNVDGDLEAYSGQYISKEDVSYKPLIKNIPAERIPCGSAEMSLTEEIELDCISEWYRYFNCRGYAAVFAGGLGTRGSDGMTSCGAEEETKAVIAVIDWLCGRRRAYTNKVDNIEVKAEWCTGRVAMSGKSYLGTLSIAAASTGVEGLKTIIPEAAICSWYDYYRYNGLNVPAMGWQGDDVDLLSRYCFSRRFDEEDYEGLKDRYASMLQNIVEEEDRKSGNYNSFWDERNYMNNADKIKASVYIVHGLNDWNVKANQFAKFWSYLDKYNVPHKMILHQGDHIYISNLESIDFNDIMHRWIDHWLYELDNGAMTEIPNVLIQSNIDQNNWQASEKWPPEISDRICFGIGESNVLTQEDNTSSREVTFIDDISLAGYDRGKDNRNTWLENILSEKESEKKYCISYKSNPLDKNIRISGAVKLSVEAALNKHTGILSAMLVDYGSDNRLTLDQEVSVKDGIWWGKNAGCSDQVRFVKEKVSSESRVITRGWTNVQNRNNNYCKEDVVSNEVYSFDFDMIQADYTLKKGHRLGLIIYGTDPEATPRPYRKTEYKVFEKSIRLSMKVL